MNAYDIANDDLTFGFGIDQAKVAAELRKLADALDSRSDTSYADVVLLCGDDGKPLVTVERFSVESIAARDDFTTTKIKIEINVVEKIKIQSTTDSVPA